MRIDGITIKNYRSIRKFDMRNLGNVNIFVGENSSGKSTVLNAIQLASQPIREFSTESEADIHHGQATAEITLYYLLNDKLFKKLFHELYLLNEPSLKKFIKKYQGQNNRRLYTNIFYKCFRKFILTEIMHVDGSIQKLGVKTIIDSDNKRERRELVLTDNRLVEIKNMQQKEIIINCLLNEPVVIPDERGFLNEAVANQESISNSVFNVFLNTLDNYASEDSDTDPYEKQAKDLSINEINKIMLERLKQHSQDFLGSIKSIFKDYTQEYDIEWTFRNNLITPYDFKTNFTDDLGNSIDFLSIGSGTRSMYIITLLQAYFNLTSGREGNSGVFLIEEPELYLYPKLEERVANTIRDLTLDNQIFITTHSANMVNCFKLEDIILVTKQEDHRGFFSQFEELETIQEIIDIFGFTITPFLNKEFVVFVEGSKDSRYYKALFNLFYPKITDKVAFVHTGGIDKIHFGLSCQLIQSTELSKRFLIICDKDWNTDEEISRKIKEQLKNINKDIRIKDYDNYFYFTEKCTNLELLLLDYNELSRIIGDQDVIIHNFVDENEILIRESFHKVAKKSWKERIDDFYLSKETLSAEEKYQFLREFVFSKNTFKKFKKSLDKESRETLSKWMSEEYIQKFGQESIKTTVPNLLKKFAYINEVITK